MQTHLGVHVLQLLRQEVRRAHPVFECSEHVLHRTSSQRHGNGLAVQALLNTFEHLLVHPSTDAPIRARRALIFDRALGASTGPVDTHLVAVRLQCIEPVDGPLPRGALVLIVLGDIDEVALVEAPLGLRVGGHRLGNVGRDARVFAVLELLATEVPAIGEGLQLGLAHRLARGQ